MSLTRSYLAPLLASLALLLPITGCDSTSPTQGILGDSTSVIVGASRRYTAHFYGVPDDAIVWSLSYGASGTIDSTGLYRAGTRPGSYTIIARGEHRGAATEEFTASIPVTVVPYGSYTNLGLPAFTMAVNAAGVIAAARTDSGVQFRSTGGTVSTWVRKPTGVVFSPGGGTAFVSAYAPSADLVTLGKGRLYRIVVATGAVADSVTSPRPLLNIALRPSDSTLYVTREDKWLFKVAPATLDPIDSVRLASRSNGITFSPDGNTLWVSTMDAGILYRIDPVTLATIDSFKLRPNLEQIAVAPSGDSVYVVSADNVIAGAADDRLFVIQPSTRTIHHRSLRGTPIGLGLSSDGTRLYATQLRDEQVTVYDRASMRVIGLIPIAGGRWAVPIPGSDAMLIGGWGTSFRVDP